MNERDEASASEAAIERAAAEWVMRCDRGLTALEQDSFSQWLAADARHRDAYALQRWSWEELDRLAGLQSTITLPNPDLVRPSPRRTAPRWLSLVAAAVVMGVSAWWWSDEGTPAAPVPTLLAAPCERRTLEDGSVVDCNRGTELEVAFTGTERRVRLLRGEASFDVLSDPARPFFVTAGDVTFRVVGTQFNVKLDPHVVEVVVREGKVQMARATSAAADDETALPLLEARDRAVMPHTPAARPLLSKLTPEALEARLAWQPRLLDFNDVPLEQIIATFNRHNVVRVMLRDRRLEKVRLSATFRSDNVEGFLRLLEAEFGVAAEWRSERQVWLRQAQ